MEQLNFAPQDYDSHIPNNYENDLSIPKKENPFNLADAHYNEQLKFTSEFIPIGPNLDMQQLMIIKNQKKKDKSKSKEKKQKTLKPAQLTFNKSNPKNMKNKGPNNKKKSNIKPLKENNIPQQDWNTDTKTKGFFDETLIKMPKFSNLNEKANNNDNDPTAEKFYGKPHTVQQLKKANKSVKFFTDLDDFNKYYEENKGNRSTNEKRVYFLPKPHNEIKKSEEEILKNQIEKLKEKNETGSEAPNPYLNRMLKKVMDEKIKKKPFVASMAVDPDKLYGSLSEDEVKKKKKPNKKYENIKPKFMEPTKNRRKSLDDMQNAIDKKEIKSEQNMIQRITNDLKNVYTKEQKFKIYSPPKTEKISSSKVEVDLVPTRENGEKQRKQQQQQVISQGNSQIKVKKLLDEHNKNNTGNLALEPNRTQELNNFYKEEIVRKVEIDKYLSEYENHVKTNLREPNTYFQNIEKGLERVKKNFEPLIEQINKTQSYINKSTGKHKLLAKTTGKLIKVYAEKITEKLIDDLTLELIPILQQKEDYEQRQKTKQRKMNILNECLEALKDLTFEQRQAKERLEAKLNSDNHIDHLYEIPITATKTYIAKEDQYRLIAPDGLVNNVKNQKRNFADFVKDDRLYGDARIRAYQFLADLLLNEEFDKAVDEFDKLQEDFVEDVFNSEF